MNKKCIYHVPYPLKKTEKTASAIRPVRMLEAFQNNFDEVFVISGYGKERRKKFEQLKKLVASGAKFEFMYSENSTMPNLMTEQDHIPRYPFLERNIFKFCKEKSIPIGLFYRDVYWKFPEYRQNLTFWKRCITIPLYKYDIYLYNKYIDVLYLPSKKVSKYVGFKNRMNELPPGCSISKNIKLDIEYEKKPKIELFYVGGVGEHYDISKIIETVQKCDFVHLTLCCPEKQWEQWISERQIDMPKNISIIHKSGTELKPYYKKADLGILFMFSEYRKLAMPFKLFEYIQNLLPIVTVNNSAAGDFVLKNNSGWAIPYDTKKFTELLSYLNQKPEEIKEKKKIMKEVRQKNTWDKRVLFVYHDLTEIGD